MRIERIRIDGFGRLACFDSGEEEALPGIVVLLGPNEAGKSTIFQFLTTMLYGFKPASREGNPFVPWGADEASGEAWLRLADGRAAHVARKLRSQPSGLLAVDGRTTDLRNREVPWVGHIPRGVFRQVFAVTLGELASLDEDTWGRIQDRVVGSMGATDLRPVRAVAEELEREAGELWRPTRRGNQKVRTLRERLRELRGRRSRAAERDREARALAEERERVADELRSRREERERDMLVLDRVRSLAPVRAQLARIRALREEAGPDDRLQGLPRDPVERLAALRSERAELERRLAELAEEQAEPTAAREACDERVLRLVEVAEEIREAAAEAAASTAERERLRDLRAELGSLEARLDAAAADLFGGPWSSETRAAVEDLSLPALRDAVERLARARLRLAEVEAEGAATPGAGVLPWVVGAALLLTAGIPLAAWGIDRGAPVWAVSGGVLALLGAWMTIRAIGRERGERSARIERRRSAERAEEEARTGVRTLLGEARVRPGLMEQPGDALVGALERLRSLSEEHARRARGVREAAERIEAVEGRVRALGERCGWAWRPGDDATLVGRRLSERLREAERIASAAETAGRELARIARERAALERRREAVVDELEGLARAADRFRDEGPSDAETGPGAGDLVPERLRVAEGCLRARELADRLEEELARSHPDLAALEERIAEADRSGLTWDADDVEVARRRARVAEHSDRIEALVERLKEIEGQIERLAGEETADAVDGEIAGLEEEIREVIRERDRKWVLAQLLREADRRFRDEHQPDLVRRASAYLAHLTAGRYDRLLIEESGAGDLFAIQGPAAAGPVPLRHPVSTGTLEQAYLSLRLAMVDHLDHGVEALPLFIDEVFVNWDGERRGRGLEVLSRIAGSRQLFVFTCHPEIAGALEGSGARVIRLERDG